MKKINLKSIKVYLDINKENSITSDLRLDFANLLYVNVNGIAAHDLAFRLYKSEGDIEITEQEENILLETVETYCVPAFIDAIKEQLNNTQND